MKMNAVASAESSTSDGGDTKRAPPQWAVKIGGQKKTRLKKLSPAFWVGSDASLQCSVAARIAASLRSTLGGKVCLDLREKALARRLTARIARVTANRGRFAADGLRSRAADRLRSGAADRLGSGAANGFRSGAANGLGSRAANGLAAIALLLETTEQTGFGFRSNGGANNGQQGNSQNRTDHLTLQSGGILACATRRGSLRRV